jgi:hypothetical protein
MELQAFIRSKCGEGLMLTMTGDRRKVVRRPTDLGARICLDTSGPELLCRIMDISRWGAGLLVTSRPASALPDQFTLLLGPDGCVQWRCRVIWTDANRVGVEFLSTRPAR